MTTKKKLNENKNVKKGRNTIEGDTFAIRCLSMLKEYRLQLGFSQSKLAKHTGVSDRVIRDIELHHVQLTHVSVLSYLKLAAFFRWLPDEADTSVEHLNTQNSDTSVLTSPQQKELQDFVNYDLSFDCKELDFDSLRKHSINMFRMLSIIASEKHVWTIGQVKRLLASVSI